MSVPPERLARWMAGFAERHGPTSLASAPEQVVLQAQDGARAELEVPFPPLLGEGPDAVVGHALRERRVGVLLVRLGGHACGVVEGRTLVASKVGSRQVHGRSAAGGQSQQRFARRREGQVRVALQAAADNAFRILVPEAAGLEAVVVGGERTAVDAVLADRRLAALVPLVTGRLLDVPDPRLRVLQTAPDLLRAVHIRVVDP